MNLADASGVTSHARHRFTEQSDAITRRSGRPRVRTGVEPAALDLESVQRLRGSSERRDRDSARALLCGLAEHGHDRSMEQLLDDALDRIDLSPEQWCGLLATVTPSLLRRMSDAPDVSRQRIVDIAGFTVDALWRLGGATPLDGMLRKLDVWQLPSAVLVAILAGTRHGAEQLAERAAFRARVEERLRLQNPEEAEAVLGMVG